MKFTAILSAMVCLLVLLFSCTDQKTKSERLARQYCASCHAFPDPGLLDKSTWENGVFPQMAFRMGVDYSQLSSISAEDQPGVVGTLPAQAMVSAEEWENIKRYYLANAPDSINTVGTVITSQLKHFQPEAYPLQTSPFITFIKSDTMSRKVFIGTRLNMLYRLNEELITEDSFMLPSPPSHIRLSAPGQAMVSLMGIMDPNDQAKGQVAMVNFQNGSILTSVDSLKRPVYFEMADLDNDGLEDFIVCAFGNYSGALVAYKNLGNGRFEKYVLQPLPGARKVVVRDCDNNGTLDILALMSQGDEKIMLFINQGNFSFRINTLLSFPPVYGSSFFDVADFNKDGKFDILYTNGDNADYSMVLKPYHGVRIYLNDGNNEFKESWFYKMHGASQAITRDFDLDGDLDIAAISFFPDFKNHPEQGFVYFENSGTAYIPYVTDAAVQGRWLTLEASDIDHDGDSDLLLGALDFSGGVPENLRLVWKEKRTSVLLLRNTIRQRQRP